jgi:hypothetical protein
MHIPCATPFKRFYYLPPSIVNTSGHVIDTSVVSEHSDEKPLEHVASPVKHTLTLAMILQSIVSPFPVHVDKGVELPPDVLDNSLEFKGLNFDIYLILNAAN